VGGSIVAGEEAEGWVRVGDRFLPHEVNGKTVLVPRGPSKFRAEGRLEDLDDEEAEEEGADSVPWRDQKEPGSARKPRETPEQRRQRVLREEEERVRDKEHEEQERRSKELLRKHRQLLQQGSSHYTALSVHRTASLEEIHEAYRKLCKVFHPDRADEKNERAARHRIMAQLTEAYGVLSCPTKRWAYDRSLPGEMEEPAPGPVALERGSVDDGQDGDFDFSGDGRPFRFCKGKAARVAKACGSREGVRLVMHQLLGKEPMELAECGGVVRHVGPMSPLGGLGECGSANCLAHRLRSPELRNGFRDFVVSKVRAALRTKSRWWGPEGLHYASLGSGELLFDLELLERLREEGVRIAKICLIDRAYGAPSLATRRALREFADWQRASAQLRRLLPAEIFVFGRLADYFEAAEKGCASDCHVFVHCDAHWEGCAGDCNRLASRALCKNGLLARLAESTESLDADLPKGALVAPFRGDEPFSTGAAESDASVAQQGGLHVGEPFFSAAWILASWPAECFKPPSLQRVEHPLLSRPEDSSRLRLLARDLRLEVWRVTCKPRIPVRAAPAASAEIVEVFYANDEVLVAEVKAPWLKVAKEHWQTDAPEAAWVLQDGSAFGLGPLLERI
ncbi:unnamed protein product, partial [Effrenium voratum]